MTPKRMNQILKIFLILLCVITIAGLYFADRKLAALANETARLKAEVEVSQKQIDSYTITKAKVENLQYVEELASQVLPKDDEQSTVVAELSQFALRSQLSVSEITFPEGSTAAKNSAAKSTKVVPKGVDVIPITVRFKEGSSYNNLLSFLRLVENNRRKTQVTNVDLKPDTEDRSVLSEVTVELNLYAKEPSTAAEKTK